MIQLGKPEDFRAHWVDDISNEQYHANREFVSSSQLKHFINESPEYFYSAFTSETVKKSTDAMLLSTLVHHAVLEGEDFLNRYVVMPKFGGHANSNAHKAEKAEWMTANRHKLIVTEEEKRTVEGTYEAIFHHDDARAILKGSTFERNGYYIDPATGIPCRIRYDSYDASGRILSDIKAVRSCKHKDFSKAIKDYRWDFSMAMYGQGIAAIEGKEPDDYVFIAVEKTAPYQVAVYPIGSRSIELGLQDYRASLSMLEQCIKNDDWPTYQREMVEIDLPEYFLKERLQCREMKTKS